jgi:hypothetical protein
MMFRVVVVDPHQVILPKFPEHLPLFDNLLNKTKQKIFARKKTVFHLHDKEQQDI